MLCNFEYLKFYTFIHLFFPLWMRWEISPDGRCHSHVTFRLKCHESSVHLVILQRQLSNNVEMTKYYTSTVSVKFLFLSYELFSIFGAQEMMSSKAFHNRYKLKYLWGRSGLFCGLREETFEPVLFLFLFQCLKKNIYKSIITKPITTRVRFFSKFCILF